jgi:hypothetical protein
MHGIAGRQKFSFIEGYIESLVFSRAGIKGFCCMNVDRQSLSWACDVSRYLLRGVVMGFFNSRFPKWAAVDAALSSEGWKLVTLLRLSPVVPWNVLNYALSVTGEHCTAPCI